jgi:DNA-binding transcriptional ArsR family regulator
MQIQRPFAVVTPTVDGDVLAVLARHDSPLTASDIHRAIGARSIEGVRLVLNRLGGQGLVTVGRVGRTATYALNRDHLAAPAVLELASLRAELVDRLRSCIASWIVQPVVAALFGSFARGDSCLESDVDLFLVHSRLDDDHEPLWSDQIARLADAVGRWTGNAAQILQYEAEEIDAGDRGIDEVVVAIARERVLLAGPEAWFASIRARHGAP